jgi:hypothetical protein
MTAEAWAADVERCDRIDVTDNEGARLGWVDPVTGSRTLMRADRADVFDEVVDFWLTAAGLAPPAPARDEPNPEPVRLGATVTEVRYPDPVTTRTLVIPLLPLR